MDRQIGPELALACLETIADLYLVIGNPHQSAHNLLIFQVSGLDYVETEFIVKIPLDLEAQQAI